MHLMKKIHDKKLMATGFSRANMVLLILIHLLCRIAWVDGLAALSNALNIQKYYPAHHQSRKIVLNVMTATSKLQDGFLVQK